MNKIIMMLMLTSLVTIKLSVLEATNIVSYNGLRLSPGSSFSTFPQPKYTKEPIAKTNSARVKRDRENKIVIEDSCVAPPRKKKRQVNSQGKRS